MRVGVTQPLFVVPSSDLHVDVQGGLVVRVVRDVAGWLLHLLRRGGSHLVKVVGVVVLPVQVSSCAVVQSCVVHGSVARIARCLRSSRRFRSEYLGGGEAALGARMGDGLLVDVGGVGGG